MKRYICSVLLAICASACLAINRAQAATTKYHDDCFNNNQKSYVLSDNRWAKVQDYASYVIFYDKNTIERENKYNPFGDRIITLWIADCFKDYHRFDYSSSKTLGHPSIERISFNLDKRQYKYVQNPKSRFLDVQPNSSMETILEAIKWLY